MTAVRATSRVLAVLGDPVAHSLSPVMHNAAISALGIDAVYVALRVSSERLASTLAALAEVGVAGNLTVPLKTAAAALIPDLTPQARALGAVNTFWLAENALGGDNTDVVGIEDALDSVEADGPWLVAGTGGTARAIAAVAARRAVPLAVRSRRPERARAFVEWARGIGADASVDDGRQAATAINATPLGLTAKDDPPFPADRLNGVEAAVDCVYAAGETAWIQTCRGAGMRATDGRTMLVGQGAAAFERFFPNTRAPRDVMHAAVRRALNG